MIELKSTEEITFWKAVYLAKIQSGRLYGEQRYQEEIVGHAFAFADTAVKRLRERLPKKTTENNRF